MLNCNYCNKEYTRKSSYNRHIILCEILNNNDNKSSKNNNKKSLKREEKCIEEESTSIPSNKQLFNIIQELAYEYKNIKNELIELKKWVETKKKKINIIEWLTNKKNSLPQQSFEEWYKIIKVDETDIEILMNENMLQTINNIIHKNLKEYSELSSPLIAFNQKINNIYIYSSRLKSSTEWIKMTQEDFIIFLKKIHSKILGALCDWYSKNKEQVKKNEKLGDTYNNAMLKLMSVEFINEKSNTSSSIASKIRTNLYNSIKNNLDNVEIEFEF